MTKNSVEERILKRARQKESVQSTVYGANLKADSFTTRDVLDMIIDDIDDDPLASLGQNRNQVKGFIKTAPGQKKQQTVQRKKKKKDDGDKVYESVKRVSGHEKYENEIEKLLTTETRAMDENGIQDQDMNGRSSGEEDNSVSDNDDIEMQSVTDRKRMLYQLLEKQTGRQVFNFEDDDIQQKPVQEATEEKRKRRGRPPNPNKVQVEEDDEEMEDDEQEY